MTTATLDHRHRLVVMSLRDLLTEFYSYATWIPDWLLTALMLAAAAGLALAVHRGTVRLAHRLVSPERKFLQSLISATDGPIRMALVIVAVAIVPPAAPLEREAQAAVGRAPMVAFLVMLGRGAKAALSPAADFFLRPSN